MTRQRAITLLSHPQCCEVCGSREWVLISGPGRRTSVPVPCPHCQMGLPVVVTTGGGGQR